MRAVPVTAVLAAAVAIPTTSLAKGSVVFEDTVPAGKASWVEITTHRAAAFRVVLLVPPRVALSSSSGARRLRGAAR